MIVKINGLGDNTYRVAANDIVAAYLKIAFWLSPLAFWKIYEIAIELIGK